MHRSAITTIAAVTVALSSIGCSYVNSSVAGQTTVNGEAWYVETTSLFGLVFSSTVYHCPNASGGPARCKAAKMVALDDEVGASASADFDMGTDKEDDSDKGDDDDDDEASDDEASDDEDEPKKKKKRKKKRKKKKRKKKKRKKKVDLGDDDDDE